MEKYINKIQVEHIDLGVITINSDISDYANDLIGEKENEYNGYCYYYGKIKLNKDRTVTVNDLYKISLESVNVGFFERDCINRNYVYLWKNMLVNDKVVFYKKSILSIITQPNNPTTR